MFTSESNLAFVFPVVCLCVSVFVFCFFCFSSSVFVLSGLLADVCQINRPLIVMLNGSTATNLFLTFRQRRNGERKQKIHVAQLSLWYGTSAQRTLWGPLVTMLHSICHSLPQRNFFFSSFFPLPFPPLLSASLLSSGDAFPGASSGFLSSYVSGSNPHTAPGGLSSEPSFRPPNPSAIPMAQLWASHEGKTQPHTPRHGSFYISLSFRAALVYLRLVDHGQAALWWRPLAC